MSILRSRTWRRRLRLGVFLLAVLGLVLARPAAEHARAASLLMTFSNVESTSKVDEERTTFDGIPARLYLPRGVPHPPAVVLVHGVHYKGIEEPRLERFARAVAGAGVAVMTPAVAELSDYKVAPRSIDTVGAAVEAMRARMGREQVGLMGMSFGGGISLLAAADPRFAEHVSFVVAVGAHDDVGRVSRFFIDDAIAQPDGSTRRLKAHGYGVMVLVYSHVEDFFPPEDRHAAREALRAWLQERRDDAKAHAKELSPLSKTKIDALFGDGGPTLHDEIARVLDAHREDMQRVSPRGHLAGLRASVYLLHGEGDTVIPSTETLWLAQDVPAANLRTALVSPAIEHVELKSPSAFDQWALVHFMGEVIGEAERSH